MENLTETKTNERSGKTLYDEVIEKLTSTSDEIITSDQLKKFYDELPRAEGNGFRKSVMYKCEWTYPVWRNKLHSVSKISKLESEAIQVFMNLLK